MIYVDIDNVLSDFIGQYLKVYNEEYGTNLIPDDVVEFSLEKLGHDPWPIMSTPGFWGTMEMTDLGYRIFNTVSGFTDDYMLLTSIYNDKCKLAAHEREEWIKRKLNLDPREKLIIASNKAAIVRPGDIIIEDSPNNIRLAKEKGAYVIRVLQPWNRNLSQNYFDATIDENTPDFQIRDMLQKFSAGPEIYSQLGTDIGNLVEEKQKAYGDSFGRSKAVIEALFPDGIPPHAYDDALAIVRIVDKLFRLATNAVKNRDDIMGESPGRDIAGYGLLIAARHEKKKKEKE